LDRSALLAVGWEYRPHGIGHWERHAIQSLELGVDTVLMDDAAGRREAERLHLDVRGTLGIIERGARLRKTDFRRALNKLDRTNFRVSPMMRAAFLERNP
jgi:predicted nucleic acid-binding protein